MSPRPWEHRVADILDAIERPRGQVLPFDKTKVADPDNYQKLAKG